MARHAQPIHRLFQSCKDRRIRWTDGRAGFGAEVEFDAAPLLDARDDTVHAFVQRGEHGLVVGADIKTEIETAGHDRHAVLGWVGVEAADGAGHRDIPSLVFFP